MAGWDEVERRASARTPKGEETHKAFLAAGLRVLDERPAEDFLPRPTQLAEAARRDKRRINQIYGNLRTFHRVLLRQRLVDGSDEQLLDDLVAQIRRSTEDLLRPEVSVAAEIADIASFNFEEIRDRPEGWRRQLIFSVAGMSKDGEWITELLREDYALVTTELMAAYEPFLEAWGRKVLTSEDDDDGWTLERVTVMLTALTEGYLLRAAFDPDNATTDDFVRAVKAMLMIVTVSDDDGSTWEKLQRGLLRRSDEALEKALQMVRDRSTRGIFRSRPQQPS